MGKALKDLYEQGAFEKSVDYSDTPPPPAFTAEELDWMRGLGCLSR